MRFPLGNWKARARRHGQDNSRAIGGAARSKVAAIVGHLGDGVAMARFPKLPLWTDALIGDTYHLTPAEFGAYMRLLIAAWRTSDCALPNDDAFLGRIVGDPKNWHRLRRAAMGFFTLRADGKWIQRRLLDEHEACARYSDKQAAAGSASALKRKNRDATAVQPELNYSDGDGNFLTYAAQREHIYGSPYMSNQSASETYKPLKSLDQVATRGITKNQPDTQPNSTSLPIPHTSKTKIKPFNGEKRAGKNGHSVTIDDPAERLSRFQQRIAKELGPNGWTIVASASDPTDPNHDVSIATCKATAAKIGKGWPLAWA